MSISSPLTSVTAVFRALADEGRLRIVLALHRHSLCVCQIVELTQLAASTVSEHLAVLKAAGVVTSRKQGRWVSYRLLEKQPPLLASILAEIARELDGDRQLCEDRKCLNEILRIGPTELCKRQRSVNRDCRERRV